MYVVERKIIVAIARCVVTQIKGSNCHRSKVAIQNMVAYVPIDQLLDTSFQEYARFQDLRKVSCRIPTLLSLCMTSPKS